MSVSLKSRTFWSSVVAVAFVSFMFKGTANPPPAREWNDDNDPALFEKMLDTNFNYTLSQLPVSGEVPKDRMPWSDQYWASQAGGIAIRWYKGQAQLPGNVGGVWNYKLFSKEELKTMSQEQIKMLSPAEKYDIFMGDYTYPTVQIEKNRTNKDMKEWEGICHGWIQAAIHHPEPNPVTVTNADGITIPFATSDINGLISHYYGVRMYDIARGHRWVGHYGDALQYLDSMEGKWIDIDNQMEATLTSWVDGKPYETSYTGRRSMINGVTDGRLCADDNYLRNTYIPQTYIGKRDAFKAQFDACGRRDDNCRAAIVESVMTNSRADASNQCGLDVQLYGYFPSLDEVKQVGVRIEPKKGGLFKRQVGLKDVNPGAFHVILANMLGIRHEAFGSNINLDLRNAEVWNQPVIGYESVFNRDVGNEEGDNEFRGAKKIKVKTTLSYVKEVGQHWDPIVGTANQKIARDVFEYKLFLDNQGRIIGGKWDEKALHPNFMWIQKKLDFKGYFDGMNKLYKSKWVVEGAAN